jgi:hypothetical protein
VVAPLGSLRQQFVLSRVTAAVEVDRPVLLVNLNPLRELYASAVLAMGGVVLTPSGPVTDPCNVGNACLRYLTLADEGSALIVDPVLAVESLIKLAPRHAADGALMILDGCQALAARGHSGLRGLAQAARERSCEFVAIGSKASDTECIADLSCAPVKLPSKDDMLTTAVNPDWLLASRSWVPPPAA